VSLGVRGRLFHAAAAEINEHPPQVVSR